MSSSVTISVYVPIIQKNTDWNNWIVYEQVKSNWKWFWEPSLGSSKNNLWFINYDQCIGQFLDLKSANEIIRNLSEDLVDRGKKNQFFNWPDRWHERTLSSLVFDGPHHNHTSIGICRLTLQRTIIWVFVVFLF